MRPRSNGRYVRRMTMRHIRFADSARDRREWSIAAQSYKEAVRAEPELDHLWIQLGHMEKESGNIDKAEAAYREAARRKPDDPEALLYLGHMAKLTSEPIQALGYFIDALFRDERNIEAFAELARLAPDRNEIHPELWSRLLNVPGVAGADQSYVESELPQPGASLLDVTDLIAFFGLRRLPTGIQRVQIEVSLACLNRQSNKDTTFCIYSSARRGWIMLPDELFKSICRLAKRGNDTSDPSWVALLIQLYRHILISRTLPVPDGSRLINLGTSWSNRNYLLDVRNARKDKGLIYVPIVFDLIPLIEPDWFTGSLVSDYRTWFSSLLHSADAYLAISEATRRDLLQAAPTFSAPVPARSVSVVRLDGEFRQNELSPAVLTREGLRSARYVLFVSTLEPRKNHCGAFEAWLALAAKLGEEAVPRLVCVGGRGWLNDHLHRMLRERPALRRMVLILHGVSDDELAGLYEHCLFVLYPSFYEGWGLPISEALSYGKVPVISQTSSMPEAGGKFARYFNPTDPADIAAAVLELLDDDTRRHSETVIRRDYRPRSWEEIARDILTCATAATTRSRESLPILGCAGVWTMAAHWRGSQDVTGTDLPSGEALRHGRAWQTPSLDGCRIQGKDAELRFRWAGLSNAELHIQFSDRAAAASVSVEVDGLRDTSATCLHERHLWAFTLPPASADINLSLVPLAFDTVLERISIVFTDGQCSLPVS